MYAVQISQNRKAYKTVTGPSSLNGAFDTYRSLANFRAPKGAKVRLVAFEGSTKPRVVRTAVAEQISPRSLFERPTVFLPTLDLSKLNDGGSVMDAAQSDYTDYTGTMIVTVKR